MLKKNDINSTLAQISALLEHIDPDVRYSDWIRVLMVIFNETGGLEAGFELADSWSSKGYKYKGEKDVRGKWRGFKLDVAKPVRIGTLVRMAALHS